MSSTRKSPTQSATLYKVGTKKIGNDDNMWIIVENTNKIKRWQLYRKKSSKKASKKSSKKSSKKASKKSSKKASKKSSKKIINKWNKKKISFSRLYNIPKIKPSNWTKWLDHLNSTQQKSVNKIRNSYESIEKETGIIVIEVILPLSLNNIYWTDYAWDHAKSLYPDLLLDDNAYMMIVYKINQNLELVPDIRAQHKGGIAYSENLDFLNNATQSLFYRKQSFL